MTPSPVVGKSTTSTFSTVAVFVWKALFPKKSPASLVTFRVGIAGLALLNSVIVTPDLEVLYGGTGIRIEQTAESALAWSMDRLVSELPSHLVSVEVPWLHILHVAYCVALALLLIGVGGRPIAVSCWLGHLAFTYAAPDLIYGVDQLMKIAFFFIMWFPDSALRGMCRKEELTRHAGLLARLLQAQVILVYTSSGWHKACGLQWWTGEAIWRALTHGVLAQFDFRWLSHLPWLLAALGIATVIVELFYAPLIIWRRTRRIQLMAIVLMHVGIAGALGMWYFSAVMIVYNIATFGTGTGFTKFPSICRAMVARPYKVPVETI